MFRGLARLNLDNKSRLAVPAKFRDELVAQCEGRLVITVDYPSPCLLIFPEPEWGPMEEKLMGFSSLNRHIRELQRRIVGHADKAPMDGAGRILVPPALREYAGLDKRVVLVGQGRKFELWSEDGWAQQLEQAIVLKDGEMPVELQGFSL